MQEMLHFTEQQHKSSVCVKKRRIRSAGCLIILSVARQVTSKHGGSVECAARANADQKTWRLLTNIL